MNSKKMFILSLGFLFYTKFFQSTIFNDIFFRFSAIFIIICLFFLIKYLSNYIISYDSLNKYSSSKIILYVCLMVLIVPLYGAFNAYHEFQQPLFYGVASLRSWWSIGFSFYILNQLNHKNLTIENLVKILVYLGYFTLAFYVFSLYFLDLSSVDSSMIKQGDSRGVRLRYNDIFTSFALIYHINLISQRFRYKNLIAIIFFLTYFFYVSQSRVLLLAFFLLSIFIVFYNSVSIKSFITKFLRIIMFSIIFLFLLSVFTPGEGIPIFELFNSLLSLFTGGNISDPSTNSRITSTLLAYSFLTKDINSLIYGAGQFSVQYQGGLVTFIDWYFYPSDIGILGGVYTFGLVGLLFMYIIPFIICIYLIAKTLQRRDVDDTHIFAFYLIFINIINIAQGRFFFMPFMIYFLILTLVYNLKNTINEKSIINT